MSLLGAYILTCVLACGLSLFFVKLAIPLSFNFKVLDVPKTGTRKNHQSATPLLGGVAIFFAMHALLVFLLLAYTCFPDNVCALFSSKNMASLLKGISSTWYRLCLVTMGGFLILMLGLKDDKSGMGPLAKLLVILFVALFLYVLNIRITFFNPMPVVSFMLTFGWMLCLTNSFNLLDNMNGLCSGVALICSFFLLFSANLLGQYFLAFYAALFLGSVLGFFIINFFKGGIFLGDNGALFIGYNLALQTILQSFFISGKSSHAAVLLPCFIFLIPIYDTLSVIFIRLKNKKPIYVGDLNHLSHRIHSSGKWTKRQTVMWVMFMACSSGSVGLAAISWYETGMFATLVVLFIMCILLYCIETLLRQRKT